MLLQRLVEYSGRIPSTPVMYNKLAVKWVIDIDDDGNFLGMSPTSDSGKKNDRGKEFQTPHVSKSSGVKAKLLADNGEYVLGKAREGSDVEKVKTRHSAFIKLIETAEQSTGEPTLKAIWTFYQKEQKNKITLSNDFDPSHNITFRVNGMLPFELSTVQQFWAKYLGVTESENKDEKSDKDVMECIVCGKTKPVLRRLPIKIKNIPKGQKAGNVLISANSPAFGSYGLEESLIAPICHNDSEKFSKAVNALLQGENTHIAAGPLVYIFWTKEETGFSFASLLSKPTPSDVQALIESVYGGKEALTVVDEIKFFASAFSASGSRVAVRDWLETTVSSAKQNLARYFSLQRIVEPNGEPHNPLGLYSLSAATVPRKKEKPDFDQLNPNVPRVLLKCALDGNTLPDWLLFQAVKRTKAEQDVRKGHAAIIKMVMLSKETDKPIQEGKMEQLELTNQEPAYLCGRLLRVIESIQYEAQGKTNTTVVGRFYGSASSAPASVFGILLQRAQANLEKLRKEKERAYKSLQAKIANITYPNLKSFPKTLNLEQQGLFALGYYHQRAKDIGDAIAYKAQKENVKNKQEADNE